MSGDKSQAMAPENLQSCPPIRDELLKRPKARRSVSHRRDSKLHQCFVDHSSQSIPKLYSKVEPILRGPNQI